MGKPRPRKSRWKRTRRPWWRPIQRPGDLNVAEVKMVTAEMVKMGTVEMVKMDTVEVVVEAEAETGMETSETVNFVLAIAVENENLTVNEDLGEVNEVIEEVEVTGAAITINNRTEAMSKRMETKS